MPRFPMPRYPNGWFQIAYSDELAPGAAKPVRYFGKDLVLFRTEAGEAKLLDAHCPHLGAHLAVGGRVEGDCIRCPFHGWSYEHSGRLGNVTSEENFCGLDRAVLGLTSLPVREELGLIWSAGSRDVVLADVDLLSGLDEDIHQLREQWLKEISDITGMIPLELPRF